MAFASEPLGVVPVQVVPPEHDCETRSPPPKVIGVPVLRPVPVTVTAVPPVVAPINGSTRAIVGVAPELDPDDPDDPLDEPEDEPPELEPPPELDEDDELEDDEPPELDDT
jgi:hypothetical protein